MNLDTLDKSFLRLVTDFSVAKSELMENSQYVYKDVIVISPSEKFTQISNSLTNIAFDDSYIVSLVDCSDNEVLDITDKIYINEFQDHNGVYQIAFEIAPIQQDFYFQRLFLKFKHLDSDLTVWSNPFICTDNIHSVRLDYKNYAYYQGISYEIANIYQSIRIAGFFNLPSSKDTTKISTLINGDIRRNRTTQALEYTYNIDAIDTFAFDRLSVALNSEVVYLDGVRFKASENVQSDERQGLSNQFATTFKGQFEARDTYTAGYQIRPAFTILGLSPLGLYTLASIPPNGAAVFTHEISTASNVQLWDYDTDTLLFTFTIFIATNSFDFVLPVLPLGNYFITFNAVDTLGNVINVTDKETWKFTIATGDYDPLDYDSTDYFTT